MVQHFQNPRVWKLVFGYERGVLSCTYLRGTPQGAISRIGHSLSLHTPCSWSVGSFCCGFICW